MSDAAVPVEGLRRYLYNLAGCEDDDFVVDMLEAFLESTADSRVQMAQGVSMRGLARAAHRLKSSFATLGLAEGAEACARLEAAALDGDAARVQAALRATDAHRARADLLAQALMETLA